MTDVLVHAVASRVDSVRPLLSAACTATGIGVRLEVYGTGSLYQRLGPRRAQPFPDIVMWFGPFAARAAAVDGMLQAFQPALVADGLVHDPDWKWTTLDFSVIGVVGSAPVASFADLARVPRLALADPERSEVGMSQLLAVLDRARLVEGDVERGWTWWRQRSQSGLLLAEDDAAAVALVDGGAASHALSLLATAVPVSGLAPIPHAMGLAASSRNLDPARRLLDWLNSEAASAYVRLSPWHVPAAPDLDIEWARQHYTEARRRWAQSGFGPTLAS